MVNTGASEADPRLRVLLHQEKLHDWSKSDSQRRFDDLFNLVYDHATLEVAYLLTESNQGSRTPGIDGVTPAKIKRLGREKFLSQLRDELKNGSYRPQPLRQVKIPKRNGKTRSLGIPTFGDRVVQMALKLILEPIFEADFDPHSYGFRPNRRAQDAIAEIHHLSSRGYEWIVEGDIRACFDNVDHSICLGLVRKRVKDRRVLKLISMFLKAGVMSDLSEFSPTLTGTPQGGVISPLLANVYLSELDRYFSEIWEREMFNDYRRRKLRREGLATFRMIRYADDFVIAVNGTEEHAQMIKDSIATVLHERLKMELSEEKTLITHIDKGFDFLGFHIFRTTGKGGRRVVLTIPSKASLASIKNKVKKATASMVHLSLAKMIETVNPILRGWTNYFRHGASSQTFGYLHHFSWWRMILWLRKKHKGMTWKETRRRYFGTNRISEGELTLFNPASQRIVRYRNRGFSIVVNWDRFHLRGTDGPINL
ncbi:MAG: group II intron reverse transcriptase/maturase [Nitrososphaerota archaeon]|nr:group II intron reverse transcriptase/maturase [Nitrososphaerota archaeon]